MKHLVIIFLLQNVSIAFGQSTHLFERFKFDSTYKIVGVCSQLDEKKVNQKWTFIISSLDKLQTAKENTTHGKELKEQVDDDEAMEIYVIKDKEVIEIYDVSPKNKYIAYHPTDSLTAFFHSTFPFCINLPT